MSSRSVVLLAAAALFAAGTARAIASESHSADVKLVVPTSVDGRLLAAGDYRFSWSEAGDKVDVRIEQGRKVVAKAEATVQELPQPSRQKEVISKTTEAGSRILEELRPRGETVALVFSGS
jgi:hypothetical protein